MGTACSTTIKRGGLCCLRIATLMPCGLHTRFMCGESAPGGLLHLSLHCTRMKLIGRAAPMSHAHAQVAKMCLTLPIHAQVMRVRTVQTMELLNV